jgi:hypothetical protein
LFDERGGQRAGSIFGPLDPRQYLRSYLTHLVIYPWLSKKYDQEIYNFANLSFDPF